MKHKIQYNAWYRLIKDNGFGSGGKDYVSFVAFLAEHGATHEPGLTILDFKNEEDLLVFKLRFGL